LDLWGGIRRGSEAATALLLATEEARRGVVQSLVADVAQNYFQLRDLDMELEIARRDRDAFSDIVNIFKKQKVGGIASDLEIARATALEAQIAAAIPETERQIALTENALSFLLGRNPGPIHRGAALTAQYSPPAVPAGLPSALLERRPDIRQAEQTLIAANANVGVAVSNFLPTIDLTAALGAVSPQLYLLTSGHGNFWNIGGALTGPIFQGGRLVGQYRQMKALRDQAQLQYQRTALSAFVDVSNALVSRRKYAEASAQDARQVGALRIAVGVVRERYVGAVSTYVEVLDAQQELFPAEIALTRARLQQLVATVQLYKALGGGWAEGERSPEKFGFRFRPELRNP
jgi:multidrug efflux system outer membrane protein